MAGTGSGSGDKELMNIYLPPDAQGLEFFKDKEGALTIFRKFKELAGRDSTKQLFIDGFDPREPNSLVAFEKVRRQTERLTIEELGLDSAVNDWDKFFGIMKSLYFLWGSDPEVLKEVTQYVVHIKRMGFNLEVGNTMEDVDVVTMNNDVVPVTSLHAHKERPLVLVSSSLS